MEVPGISASDPVSLAPTKSRDNMDKGTFMQLLVTQLANQDPLSPTQNEDFIAQLATFSSVEQLESINDSMVAMITLNQSNALLSQMTQASSLIGSTVSWEDLESGMSRKGMVDSVVIQDGFAFLRVGDQDIPLAAVNEILDEGLVADSASTEGSGTGEDSE